MDHRPQLILLGLWFYLGDSMAYKFERLEVWQMAVEYIDLIYKIADALPRSEEYNLKSQIIRAATSINLNVAEGSTGQSDAEQDRFLGMASRSLIETVACLRLIKRRNYVPIEAVQPVYMFSEKLSIKLQAFRKALS